MTALELIDKYISFFEKRGHKRISNFPLVPENDPTTLFTSSGMQPLVPYLLGEPHSQGRRLVNVQNCFRAQDVDEVGDNRHTTFFRMLGNWSLGDYSKKEQLPWFFEFLTQELEINPQRLYVSVFAGFNNIPRDRESCNIWKGLFESVGINPQERIVYYGSEMNWWSRAGAPDDMPEGEPGGSASEVFYQFDIEHNPKYGKTCHLNCQCGRFLEIGNSVFMEYQKKGKGFVKLLQKNVDFGGGLERLLAAVEEKQDIFQTSLLSPIIKTIESQSARDYKTQAREMRIIADHLIAACFMIANGVTPSNKEQGYILRRLLRRAIDQGEYLGRPDPYQIIESIVEQYKKTDPVLVDKFETIKYVVVEEENNYRRTTEKAQQFIFKKYIKREGGELMSVTKISADDAFVLYSTHGLSPTQIKSLGFVFNEKDFAERMKKHQEISRKSAGKKFAGGLADHNQQTIRGHTATHLLHQALRDILGPHVYQTGSNITSERIRFDFSHQKKLTEGEIKKVEEIVNQKIKENLPVHFEIMMTEEAKKNEAIGLFEEKYGDKVKVYFVGDYSIEFCGGPHVCFTGELKSLKIKKEEALGQGKRRIYATLAESS